LGDLLCSRKSMPERVKTGENWQMTQNNIMVPKNCTEKKKKGDII
jgi:hypothetical protein